jgi:hypothetical protein
MSTSPAKVGNLAATRRVIYLLVALAVVLPYVFHPAPMKFEPSKDATFLFKKVDALKPGSHMILSVDYDPSSQAELYPMTQAVLRHCFRKGVVPVVMTFNIAGINLAKDLVENAAAENWETCTQCVKGISFPCDKKDMIKYVRDRASEFVKENVAYQGVLDVLGRIRERSYSSLDDLYTEAIFNKWKPCSRCIKDIVFPCKKKDLLNYVRERRSEYEREHIPVDIVLDVLGRVNERSYKDLEDVRSEQAFSGVPEDELLSGRDYVFLGFKTGGANLLINMGGNLKGAFETDYYSQPTALMPALKGVNSLKNFDFAFVFTASGTYGTWMVFGSDRYGFPLGTGTTAVMAPDLIPFVSSGQLAGYLGGLRGAADYELLLNRSADGVLGMYAQSTAHVLVILLILYANIRLLVQRWAGRRKD